MDGPGLIKLTIDTVPQAFEQVLARAEVNEPDVDLYLVHQATHKLLESLRQEMHMDEARMPTVLRDFGNTVSSTLPIVINELRNDGRLRRGTRSLLAGYGVGFSWAGCMWTELWENKAVKSADLEAA
jgi:3-oxoacyl-[acyl-carrier-protein] synthase-3